jgi:hypothetical protein
MRLKGLKHVDGTEIYVHTRGIADADCARRTIYANLSLYSRIFSD